MEEIEYLEEYEDLVLPAINSAAVAATNASQSTANVGDDEGSSSSLDQDIFNCLFDDNSDDDNGEQQEQSMNDEANLNYNRVSRPSLDSVDLLNDLGEQVAKEFELEKDIVSQHSQKKYNSAKSTTKAQPKEKPRTASVKSSEATTTKPANRTAKSTVKTKSVATVRPTVQNKEVQKKLLIVRQPSLGQHTARHSVPIASIGTSKTTTTKPLHPARTRKTLQSATSTLPSLSIGRKSTSTPLKSTLIKHRPATIVKPEKIVTKDPPEDPLNLDDLSSSESANYSVSDISGETYNSISDFDDDDYDFTSHIENLDEDDESSNSQIIDISNDSSGSRSQFEDLRASTPSPVVSDDRDLSGTPGSLKQRSSSPKFMANHEIIKSLLTKGEKPKLLQLITQYDSAESLNITDKGIPTNTKPLKATVEHATVILPPKELSNENDKKCVTITPASGINSSNTKDQEDFAKTCATTMDYSNNSRDTQSPGTMSHDSYLSVVNEMLEESYAEAMKSSKHDGLPNQEVGAEMEIGVEEITEVYLCREEEGVKETSNSEKEKKQPELFLKDNKHPVGSELDDLDATKASENNQRINPTEDSTKLNESGKALDEQHVSADEEKRVRVKDSTDVNKTSSETTDKKRLKVVTLPKDKDFRGETPDDEDGFQGFHDETTQKLPNSNITKSDQREELSGNVEKKELKTAVENENIGSDHQEATTSKVNSKKCLSGPPKTVLKISDKSKKTISDKGRSHETSNERPKETVSKYLIDSSRAPIRNPFVQRTIIKNVEIDGSRAPMKAPLNENSVTDGSRERYVDNGNDSKLEINDGTPTTNKTNKKLESKDFKSIEDMRNVKLKYVTNKEKKRSEKDSNIVKNVSKDMPNSLKKEKEIADKKPFNHKPLKGIGTSLKSVPSKSLNKNEDIKKFSISKESKTIFKKCKSNSSLLTECQEQSKSNKNSGLPSKDITTNLHDGKGKDIKNTDKYDNKPSISSFRASSKERKEYKKSIDFTEKQSKVLNESSDVSNKLDRVLKSSNNPITSTDSTICGENKRDLKPSETSTDLSLTTVALSKSNAKMTLNEGHNFVPESKQISKNKKSVVSESMPESFRSSDESRHKEFKDSINPIVKKSTSSSDHSQNLYNTNTKHSKASPKCSNKTRYEAKKNTLISSINNTKDDKAIEIKGTKQQAENFVFEKESLKSEKNMDSKIVKVISKEGEKWNEAYTEMSKNDIDITTEKSPEINKEILSDTIGGKSTETTEKRHDLQNEDKHISTKTKDTLLQIKTTDYTKKVENVENSDVSNSDDKSLESEKTLQITNQFEQMKKENKEVKKNEYEICTKMAETPQKLCETESEEQKVEQKIKVSQSEPQSLTNFSENIIDCLESKNTQMNPNRNISGDRNVDEGNKAEVMNKVEVSNTEKIVMENCNVIDAIESKSTQMKFNKNIPEERNVDEGNKAEGMNKVEVSNAEEIVTESNEGKLTLSDLCIQKPIENCNVIEEHEKPEIDDKKYKSTVATKAIENIYQTSTIPQKTSNITENVCLKQNISSNIEGENENNATEEDDNKKEITEEHISKKKRNIKVNDSSASKIHVKGFSDESEIISTESNIAKVNNITIRSAELDDLEDSAVKHDKEISENKKDCCLVNTPKKLNSKHRSFSAKPANVNQKPISNPTASTTDEIQTEDFDKNVTSNRSDMEMNIDATAPQKSTRKTRSANVCDDRTDVPKSIDKSKRSKGENIFSKLAQRSSRKTRNTTSVCEGMEEEFLKDKATHFKNPELSLKTVDLCSSSKVAEPYVCQNAILNEFSQSNCSDILEEKSPLLGHGSTIADTKETIKNDLKEAQIRFKNQELLDKTKEDATRKISTKKRKTRSTADEKMVNSEISEQRSIFQKTNSYNTPSASNAKQDIGESPQNDTKITQINKSSDNKESLHATMIASDFQELTHSHRENDFENKFSEDGKAISKDSQHLDKKSMMIIKTKEDNKQPTSTVASDSKNETKVAVGTLTSQLSHELKKEEAQTRREALFNENQLKNTAKSTPTFLTSERSNKDSGITTSRESLVSIVNDESFVQICSSNPMKPPAILESSYTAEINDNPKGIEGGLSTNDTFNIIEKASALKQNPPRVKTTKAAIVTVSKNSEISKIRDDIKGDTSTYEKSDIFNRARTLRKRGTESPFPANVPGKEQFKQPAKILCSAQLSPNLKTNIKRKLRSPALESVTQLPLSKRVKMDSSKKVRSSDNRADRSDVAESSSKTSTEVNQQSPGGSKSILMSSPQRTQQKEKVYIDRENESTSLSQIENRKVEEVDLQKSLRKDVADIDNTKSMDKTVGEAESETEKIKPVQKPYESHKTISTNKKINHSDRNKGKLSPDKKKSQAVSSPEKSPSCTVLSFAEWLKNNNRKEATHEQQPIESQPNQGDSKCRKRPNKPSSNTLQLKTTVPVVAKQSLQSSKTSVECIPNDRAVSKLPTSSNANQRDDSGKDTPGEEICRMREQVSLPKKLGGDTQLNETETKMVTGLQDTIFSLRDTDIPAVHNTDIKEFSSSPSVKSRAKNKLRRQVLVRKGISKSARQVTKNVESRPSSLSPTKEEKSKCKRSETDILIESMSKEMKDGGIEDLLNDSNHVKRHRISSKRRAQADSSISNSTDATINSSSDVAFAEKTVNNKSKMIEFPEADNKLSVCEISQIGNSSIRRPQSQEKPKKSFVSKESNKESIHKQLISIEMEKALIDEIEIKNMNSSLLEPLKHDSLKAQHPSNRSKTFPFKAPKPPEKSATLPLTSLNNIQSVKDISQLYSDRSTKLASGKVHPSHVYTKQPLFFKCRELKVRLNRSLVKKYKQHLKKEDTLKLIPKDVKSNYIKTHKRVPRSLTLSTPVNTSSIQKETSTDCRMDAVVGSAKKPVEMPTQHRDEEETVGITTTDNETLGSSTHITSEIQKQTAQGVTKGTPMSSQSSLSMAAEIDQISSSSSMIQTTHADRNAENGIETEQFTEVVTEPVVPIELKNEFLDENPCSLDDTILPDTPTLMARAHSITQAAANALSNTNIPTDIRLLTNDPMSTSTYVPSFGVTPTLVDAKGTRMYTFLHPAKYSRNHGNVLLDYCCPNLDGPMPAIDPTRIHAQIQTPVIELPAFIVLTTKVITRAELETNSSAIPDIIRKKAEKLRSSIAMHHNVSPGTTINAAASPLPYTVPPRAPQLQQLQKTPQIGLTVMRPPHLAPTPHFSPALNALTKYLPSTTTITAKIRPPLSHPSLTLGVPNSNSNQQTSAISVVAKGPPLLNEMQVNLLRSNLKRFDVMFKKLVQPFDKLNFTERHQIIDNLVASGKFLPKDLDRTIVLMEEYSKQMNTIQRHQLTSVNSYNMPLATTSSQLSNLASIQMPPLQPAPNLSSYKDTTSQQQVQNTAIRKVQSTMKQHNTTVNTATIKQRQVPIYDTERNIIGYQLQVITPTPSTPAYAKSTMAASTGGLISSSLDIKSCNQRKAVKRGAQDSPRVFYTSQPLQTSTPKSNLNPMQYPVTPLATTKNTQAIAKSQKGSIVTTVRSAGPTSAGTETITTTTLATVKRVTRSRAAGSKIIIVSKSSSNEESILPDVSHQTEIKNEKDVEDFVG